MTADAEVENIGKTLTAARRKFLHSVFVTACEGGIQGWARLGTYHWMKPEYRNMTGYQDDCEDTLGFHATITSTEGGWGVWPDERDEQELRIDLDVLHWGTVKFVQYCHGIRNSDGEMVDLEAQKPLPDDHYWRQFLVAEATNGEDGDYDAEVADIIVQFGLFGKLVFG